MRRLLLVSQRPQEYGGAGSVRWRFLRSELPAHGWDVRVVTARPNPSGNEYATDATHARLHRARAAVMGAAGAAMRPVAHRVGIEPEALAPSALWAVTGRGPVRRAIAEHAPDVIWATGPPPAAYFVLAGLRGELRAPVVCEFRDNWAGNPYYDRGGSLLRRVEAWGLSPATAVVVVTPPMADVVSALHPEVSDRVHVLPNGFDPRVLEARRPRRQHASRRLTAIHAGPLHGYPGRTIEPVLAALRHPSLAGRYELELVGPGTQPEAQSLVHVRPSVAWEQAIEAQAQADVGIVLHSSDRTALGTKVFELLALGKPVLALVEPGNALDGLLRSLGQGAGCVRHDDVDGIVAALQRLADDPPPPVPAADLLPWSRRDIAGRVAALLDELAP